MHSSGKRIYVNGGRCSWAGTSACWLPFQTSASSPYAYSKYDSLLSGEIANCSHQNGVLQATQVPPPTVLLLLFPLLHILCSAQWM